MTENFKLLLYAFGKAVRGEKVESGKNIDIKNLMALATNQGIKQVVFSALCDNYDMSAYELSTLSSVAQNIRKNRFIYDIVQKLKENGIECCYLKGLTVARFYAEPDSRISGDTDIFVDKKNVKKLRQILSENGFKLESFTDTMYHFEARHPIGGLLEVHYSFYRDKVKDLIFENSLRFDEPHIELELNGMKIKTMGVNDSLNYLTAHMVKHFITDGIALRQIMDILLYVENYKSELLMEEYYEFWDRLGFKDFIATIFGIGTKYWGFAFGEYSDENVEKLLDDIENGGLFGFNEKQRKHFLDVFFAKKYESQEKVVEKYMNKNILKRIYNLLLPNKTYMKKRGYREIEKGGIYVVFAYVHRWYDLLVNVLKGRKSIKKAVNYSAHKVENEVQLKRIDLMQKLNMFEKNR